jgi:MFS family permease
MAQATIRSVTKVDRFTRLRVATVSWLLTAVFYFYQYAMRSAPAVMMPQLSDAFGLSAMAVASVVGLFYYGYSPFSLVAGAAMDRWGPRRLVPFAAVTVGVGALLFASGNIEVASIGRFLQGVGGVFALVTAIYIATRNFPASQAATLIGATQMFGMAGGSAGQFIVGPLIAGGVAWNHFWIGMGIAGLLIGVLLFFLIPNEKPAAQPAGWLQSTATAFGTVFKNPQSILCGLIAGLLFIPTTIFDMIWGVRYLQEAHGFDYGSAVMRSAAVPFGWIIGCPLLGFISDRIGRRKPVIIGGAIVLLVCLAWILYGKTGVLPPYLIGRRRTRIGCGDAAVHRNQGSQSSGVWRHRYGCRQLFEFYFQRCWAPSSAGFCCACRVVRRPWNSHITRLPLSRCCTEWPSRSSCLCC